MRAFIFPGQGSQAVGMGAALADASRAAKDVFDEVDEALRQNLFRIMREGPEDELKLTENAQPAIMAHSIAVLRAMGVRLSDVASFVAGHSLGEYSALCAADSFDLATTAKLLKLRGQAMQQSVPVGEGGMAALMHAVAEERAYDEKRDGDLGEEPHVENGEIFVENVGAEAGPLQDRRGSEENQTEGVSEKTTVEGEALEVAS